MRYGTTTALARAASSGIVGANMTEPTLPAGSLLRLRQGPAQPQPSLSTRDLALELRARLRDPALAFDEGDLADQLGALGLEIETRTESPRNRLSRTRVAAIAQMLAKDVASGALRLDGATVVDLGCGSIHPLGPSLLHVLGGARRAVGIDMDPPQDPALATRALLRLALACLAAPEHVIPWTRRTRADVLAALDGFDLAKLWLGDPAGIDDRRLRLHHGPAERMPFADGEVDACTSVSFLEHVADVDAVLAELARVVRPGGIVVHAIDGVDHASYGDAAVGPLDFLREPYAGGRALVGGCNRLRPVEFVARFEQAGFTAVEFEAHARIPVDDGLRAGFAEPWRSMATAALAEVQGAIRARRRA